MTPEQIKQKVLEYRWEFWFDRPFGAFLMSFWKWGQSREGMQRVGVDVEWPAILFQNGVWYRSEEIWEIFEKQLKTYLDNGGTVADVVRCCEDYMEVGREKIIELSRSSLNEKEELAKICKIFSPTVSFIWLTHGFEHLYSKILHSEVPKYMAGDVEKNIGDISYPKKKNAHYYFIEALKGNDPLEKIQQKFGWIKARGGFAPGFSIEELSVERKRLETVAEEVFTRPPIPYELKNLAEISQDLVYLRTLRTDVLFELMWIARPILTKIARSFDLSFEELRDYDALALIDGKKEKYEYGNFSAISWGSDFAFSHEPIFKFASQEWKNLIKGSVAYKGLVRGVVKIVKVAQEIGKVKEGDILVAPTTAPSFIIGMHKAAAFVTDEGGITSHAAIVSREMKKPCIIGTKIATRVLKDGDEVEVDAEKGIVKILEKNGK
jgi:phosphohistidine swiveling domain-containing protein